MIGTGIASFGYEGAGVSSLPTPCLVVDLDRLERNIERMAAAVASRGVGLRPHVKTHKTVEVAELQLRHGAVGITVAKLGEAEALVGAGSRDVLIAYELLSTEQVRRLAALAEKSRVRCLVDSFAGAARLSEAARRVGVSLDVLMDVDTGLERTGVVAGDVVKLGGRISDLPGLTLTGVFSYAGYRPKRADTEERRRWALREADGAVAAAEALRRAGIPAVDVSIAGTSSALTASDVDGVTEVRPGTYVFGDANYARLGINTWDDCALQVFTTVVSRPTADRAVLDAGSKALSSDASSVEGAGYGFLPQHPSSRIERLWEEHAVVNVGEDDRHIEVGDVVGVIPNHVCAVVNLFDSWYGARGGRVESCFRVAARGRSS
jgi:D-serine deaminase-like pyridoxal phosphate-dependent protein